MNKSKAVYAGTFDPLHYGHTSIIEKAAKLPFDTIVVAITTNQAKVGRFELAERLEMLNLTLDWMGLSGRVSGDVFTGKFLAYYCKEIGATHAIRGIRTSRDLDNEMSMVETNADIFPELEHVWLPCERQYQNLSSSLIMGLVGPKGWQDVVKKYVPKPVFDKLSRR